MATLFELFAHLAGSLGYRVGLVAWLSAGGSKGALHAEDGDGLPWPKP